MPVRGCLVSRGRSGPRRPALAPSNPGPLILRNGFRAGHLVEQFGAQLECLDGERLVRLLNRPADPVRDGGQRDGQRRESLQAYMSAYVVAAKLVTKLMRVISPILAADRAATAAESQTARVWQLIKSPVLCFVQIRAMMLRVSLWEWPRISLDTLDRGINHWCPLPVRFG
jgi:hypothetical protein